MRRSKEIGCVDQEFHRRFKDPCFNNRGLFCVVAMDRKKTFVLRFALYLFVLVKMKVVELSVDLSDFVMT